MDRDAERLVRHAYDLYSQGDFPGLLELFAPDVEVYVAPPNFESGTYHGHQEYLELVQRWGAAWDEMRTVPRSIEMKGDWALASVEYIGRGAGSTVEVTQPSWELSQWRDGLCRLYRVYWDRDEGLRAFEDASSSATA
jgi:ketosteroid isomerase-like protein